MAEVLRLLSQLAKARREKRNGHRACVAWFTGLPGAGKSTLAYSVEETLQEKGLPAFVLDGDYVRLGLCSDLGFSPADRSENLRRVGEVAKLFVEAGVIVLAAFVSPMRADRDRVREIVGAERFAEIFVDCPLAVCETRDPKGMYRRAKTGELPCFTGISAPYEAPLAPALTLETETSSLDDCITQVLATLAPLIRS